MTEPDDLTLVKECLDGRRQSFGTLIERYQRPLFNTAYRMVGSREDAEDVTQTVFVKAFEKLSTFNAEFKFFSWIYRMLINECINFLNQRRPQVPLSPELPALTQRPDEECSRDELSEQVWQVVLELSPDYRLAVILRYFEDLSYREMGQLLGIPEKTVKSRLFTARQQLLVHLQKRGITAND